MSQAWEPSRGAATGLQGPEGRALTRPVGPEGSCALRPLSGPLSRTTSETWDTRSQAEPLVPSGRLPAGSSLHPTGRETEAQMTNIPVSGSEPAPGAPPPGLGSPLCGVGNRGHTGAPRGRFPTAKCRTLISQKILQGDRLHDTNAREFLGLAWERLPNPTQPRVSSGSASREHAGLRVGLGTPLPSPQRSDGAGGI